MHTDPMLVNHSLEQQCSDSLKQFVPGHNDTAPQDVKQAIEELSFDEATIEEHLSQITMSEPSQHEHDQNDTIQQSSIFEKPPS